LADRETSESPSSHPLTDPAPARQNSWRNLVKNIERIFYIFAGLSEATMKDVQGRKAFVGCEEIGQDGTVLPVQYGGIIRAWDEKGILLHCYPEELSEAEEGGDEDDAPGPHLWFVPWGRVLHVFVPLGK
jgi:hypothetical protein